MCILIENVILSLLAGMVAFAYYAAGQCDPVDVAGYLAGRDNAG